MASDSGSHVQSRRFLLFFVFNFGSIFRQVAMLLWSIWWRRNGKIWENVDRIVAIIKFAMGFCLTDDSSAFICTKYVPVFGLVNPAELEALTLFEAINWLADLGYNRWF